MLVWDVTENYLLHCIDVQPNGGFVSDCCWSDTGRRVLSVGSDGRARLWDAEGGGELCQVGGWRRGCVGGGQAGRNSRARLWDAEAGGELCQVGVEGRIPRHTTEHVRA